MSVEKVKIPREVAEVLEEMWGQINNGISDKHVTMTNWNFLFARSGKTKILMNYAKESPITYMTALVDGYEIEETKEEKVLGYYKYSSVKDEVKELRQCVIKNTLDLLEIKIEGINA